MSNKKTSEGGADPSPEMRQSQERILAKAKEMRARLVNTLQCNPPLLHSIDIASPFGVEFHPLDIHKHQVLITIHVTNDDKEDLVRRVRKFLCIYLAEPENNGFEVVTQYVRKKGKG